MASLTVSAETALPVERVWAWWTDYGPTGSESVVDHGTGRTRRLVKARWGTRVVLEERPDLPGARLLAPFRHSVDLDERARLFVETGPGYDARWTFDATAAGGTRITRTLTPRGLGKLAPAALSRHVMERDLSFHVREMERELLPPSGK